MNKKCIDEIYKGLLHNSRNVLENAPKSGIVCWSEFLAEYI